ncbi:MAG: hypothetical protein ACI3WR_04395 [Oscillospiraceae bacterium]
MTLSEEHATARLALTAALLIVAAIAFVYALSSYLQGEPGWTQIEANAGSETNCGDDFLLLYELGVGENASATEKKALTQLYTELCEQAYRLFNYDEGFEGVNNVYALNQNPNEVLEVDQALYDAFSLLQRYGDRSLYMAPIYARYDDIFFCDDDVQTYDYDPYQNEDVAAEYRELAAYAADPAQVDLQLLGGGKVKLFVSEEYLAYARENGISSFIDFFWMKNAFITDYLAEGLAAKGYTSGTLSSYDGFSRNLDDRDITYSFNIYDRVGTSIYSAAVMEYSGCRSFVALRNYPTSQLDRWHYYEFSNGEIRSSYLDIRDGCCRSALPDLVAYSSNMGCAQTLLEVSPLYIADKLDEEALNALGGEGVFSVYCKDFSICYNDKALQLSELYDSGGVRYTAQYHPCSGT